MRTIKTINLYLLLFATFILSSCNNPLHRAYNPETYEDDMQAIRMGNKVSDEDLKSLANYIIIARLAGNNLQGKSYEDLLEKITVFRQNNDALNGRQAMENESKRIRMSPFLKVSLQNKIFSNKNNKEALVFTLIFTNTGTQKIKTITGNLAINDLMEKLIKNLAIFLDQDILPGQTLTRTYPVDYNDADENDRRLRSKDSFNLRIVWNPEKIILENGKLIE